MAAEVRDRLVGEGNRRVLFLDARHSEQVVCPLARQFNDLIRVLLDDRATRRELLVRLVTLLAKAGICFDTLG
jgi:hypothetical protein